MASDSRILEVDRLNVLTPDGDRKIFGPLSFECSAGEVVRITGQNGSGKSTLLKTIVARNSDYRLQGKITRVTEKIGYLPQLQNETLMMSITLGEVVRLDAAHSTQEIVTLGLLSEAQLEINWNTASGGEKKRALLSRLLLAQNDLLVLDEPFNHLDQRSIELGYRALSQYIKSNSGRGILIVSHADDLGSFEVHKTIELGVNDA